ncbi:hypothetical protein [uncultured Prevotella sp.]|uniref:hypothetical protein n=1 Tax=uncultured Prevotella sp. TaxID=159272 RepID=UPI002616EEDF|nr:hypothetical protein [uncultured Prevotella sp.]
MADGLIFLFLAHIAIKIQVFGSLYSLLECFHLSLELLHLCQAVCDLFLSYVLKNILVKFKHGLVWLQTTYILGKTLVHNLGSLSKVFCIVTTVVVGILTTIATALCSCQSMTTDRTNKKLPQKQVGIDFLAQLGCFLLCIQNVLHLIEKFLSYDALMLTLYNHFGV